MDIVVVHDGTHAAKGGKLLRRGTRTGTIHRLLLSGRRRGQRIPQSRVACAPNKNPLELKAWV
jgi:hypothetical protein